MHIITWIFVIGATITDIKSHKIKNNWVIIFFIIGLIQSAYLFGMEGVIVNFLGSILIVFIALIPFFIFKGLSGGDIKMLMIIGGIEGLQSTVYIVLIGCCIALLKELLLCKSLRSALKKQIILAPYMLIGMIIVQCVNFYL